MRVLFVLMASAFVLVGCRHPKPAEDPLAFKPKGKADKAALSSTSARALNTPQTIPRATPLSELSGKVISVNAALRFAVLDFYLAQLPPVDQRLSVYRQGLKVGEVKITGPARDHNIVADITAGEASTGDEVRSN